MTLSEHKSLPCPKCGRMIEVEVYQSINVTLAPQLKEALFERQVNHLHCDDCEIIAGIHPLLYHDMEAPLMIQWEPNSDGSEMDSVADTIGLGSFEVPCRMVDAYDEMVEKVFIADAGLDDRTIEILKLFLLTKVEKLSDSVLYFAESKGGTGADSQNICFAAVSPEGVEGLEVNWAQYLAIDTELDQQVGFKEKTPNGKFCRVNLDWAKARLSDGR